MNLRWPSCGREANPAKGEPAQSGREHGGGCGNETSEA